MRIYELKISEINKNSKQVTGQMIFGFNSCLYDAIKKIVGHCYLLVYSST